MLKEKYKFNSKITYGSKLPNFTQIEIKNEPMLFGCDLETSIKLGGPITQKFLEALPATWINDPTFILDTRVHMLMKNWFPCIPGYHHDSVIRETPISQPNYDIPNHAQHAMALINGDICPTEFAIGRNCEMDAVPDNEIIYKNWHNQILNKLENGLLQKMYCPTNQIVFFDWQTFHQGTKAISNGWRWFGRVSINDGRKPANELRRQVQVYLEHLMEGW